MYNTGLTISCGTGLKIESVLTAGEIADRDATAVDVANQESVVHFGEILAGYARGSIFRGGAAYWEVHDAKTNHFILVGDGTDIVSKAFDWDDMAAGVAADMVHDHSSAAEGGATLGLTAITGAGADVPDGWYLGIGAGLERIVFDATSSDITIRGAWFGVGVADPGGVVEIAGELRFSGTDTFVANIPQLYKSATSGLVISGCTGTSFDLLILGSSNTPLIRVPTGTTNLELVPTTGNIGIDTAVFGTNAAAVLGIGNGTVPTTSPVNMIQLFSVDCSDAKATLGLRTEQVVEAGAMTPSHKLKVVINGTEYYMSLDAV